MGNFVSNSVRKTVLATLTAILCIPSISQPKYSFSRFKNTIPTIVEDISQDKYGRIWLGTWNGLYRYDGEEFQVFKKRDNIIENGLWISQRFDMVEPDSYGNVWLLGNDKSLYLFKGSTEDIDKWDDRLYKRIFRPSPSDIFFVTEENIIKRSCYSNNGKDILFEDYFKFDSNTTINGIYEDIDGIIWIYTDSGLFRDKEPVSNIPVYCCEIFEDVVYFGSSEGRIIKSFDNKLNIINSGIHADIRIIAKCGNGNEFIIGSAADGLYSTDFNEMILYPVKGSPYHEAEWEYASDSKGNLWLYSKEGSVNWYNPVSRELQPFFNNEIQQNWDSEVRLHSLLVDAQNAVILGGSWRGIEIAIPTNEEFKIKTLAPAEASPEERSTRAIMQTEDNSMIVSTKDGSIHLLDKNLVESGKWNCGFPVYDICQAPDGTIWMASKEGGILEFAPGQGPADSRFNFKRYTKDLDYYSPIGNKAYCVQIGHNGRLWISYFDESVSFLDSSESGRKFISKRNMISFPTKYQNKTRFLCFGKEGEMYACGQLGIHICSDPEADAEKLHFNPIECVEGKDIQHLMIISNNEMYASSFGHGFIHMIKKDGKWTASSYSVEDGLLSNYVLSSIMDSEGNIWIATYLGLNKLLPESGIIISYTDDRLGYNLSFNEGEPILGNDGNIYFNTNMGLLYFDPENISHNSYRPQIYIKSCYINGKRANLETKCNGTPYIKTRRSNRLIIDFNSVDIVNPEGVTYSYRIGSKSWNHIGNNSSIILDKLRPGRYKLEVKSTNAEGYEVNNTFSTEILVQVDIIHIIFGIVFILLVCSCIIFYTRKRSRIKENESNIERDRFIERFNSFIEENIDNSSLGVNEMAVEFGMSRSSFYNRINEYIGQSPAEYIRNARLKKACELMGSKELSIAQISYMTGFNDPHYFGKAFKKEFGMTPTEFRKKNQA